MLAPQAHAGPSPGASIPWSDLGAHATRETHGDALRVWREGDMARLNCAFQRMGGEVTAEGLWLRSTVATAHVTRFSVRAVAVGRTAVPRATDGDTQTEGAGLPGGENGTAGALLAARGEIEVADGLARWVRAGLVEEYSVSVDGVRQDFLVTARPD